MGCKGRESIAVAQGDTYTGGIKGISDAELTCLGAWKGKNQDIEGGHAKWHGKDTNRTCEGNTRGPQKAPWSNHSYLLCRNT